MDSDRAPDSDVTVPGQTADVARIRGMFTASPHGIAILDLDGRYLEVNPAFCTLLGRDPAELVGFHWTEPSHPGDHAMQQDAIAQLLGGDAVPPFTKRYRRPGGDEVVTRLTPSLVRGADDAPVQMVATVEDITAQEAITRRLARDRSVQRVAGRVARLGGWVVERPSGERTWSEEVFALLEHPDPATAVDCPQATDLALDRYHPDDRPTLDRAFAACATEGTPFDLALRAETFTGRPVWVRVVGEAEREERGAIRRIVGAFQDVSDTVASQAATDAVRARLTRTVEQMHEGLILLDRDDRFTFLNVHAETLLQVPSGRLLDRHLWDPELNIVGSTFEPTLRAAIGSRASHVVEELYDPPRDRWLSLHVHPSDDGLAVYLRDVTAERTAREALVERERLLTEQAALLNEAQDAIHVTDLAGCITFWNRSATQLYGWSEAEAVGRNVRTLLHADPQAYDRARHELLDAGAWAGEFTHLSRSGEPLTIEARWTLVRDDHGQATTVLALNTDVSERRRTEQQVLRAQRMESIGTLASGIAHDLNNVLSPVLLSIQLLLDDERDERRRDTLRTIESSARRGAEMVSQVVSFARGVEGKRLEVRLPQLLWDVERIVRDTFPKHLELGIELEGDVPSVEGDPTQLHQVLVNLAVNARDAMPDTGTGRLTMHARRVHLAHTDAESQGVAPGPHVRLDVTDTGSGMAPEVVDRVFEPFFTTKPHGEGSGLGLSTSQAIVLSHGGSIQVVSRPGRGTRFTLHLPAFDAVVPASAQAATVAPPRGGGERVLLIDDEDGVRHIARLTLERAGYVVTEATDGAAALTAFDEQPDAYAVVLTDVMMPRMDGATVIRALQRRRADLPIVASSGLRAELTDRASLNVGAIRHLLKPYSAAQLLTTIRAAIDGATSD